MLLMNLCGTDRAAVEVQSKRKGFEMLSEDPRSHGRGTNAMSNQVLTIPPNDEMISLRPKQRLLVSEDGLANRIV